MSVCVLEGGVSSVLARSMLAEDALNAAIGDYRKKNTTAVA